MSFNKKTKQKLISLVAAASMIMPCFCVTGIAAAPCEIDCSKDLDESGAYSLGDIDEQGSYTIDDIEDKTLTLEEFKEMLRAEENIGHTVICNFETLTRNSEPVDSIQPIKDDWIDTLNLKYGENGEKNISVKRSTDYDQGIGNPHLYTGITIGGDSGTTGTGQTSSGYKRLSMNYKIASSGLIGGRAYTYEFSASISEDTVEVVKAVGLVSVLHNDNLRVVADYVSIADGSSAGSGEFVRTDESGNNPHSTFLGFQAPENCYIARIKFYPVSGFIGMDDLSLITQELSSDMIKTSRIEMTAPDTVETPCYACTLEYDYSVKAFDQFGTERDEVIVVEVDDDDVAEVTEDGMLIIKQRTDMPDTITLSAYVENAPDVIAEKVITVDKSTSPYYDGTKIGVQNGNDDYVLSEFISDMEDAVASPDKEVTMITFDSSEEEMYVDRVRVPLLKDREKFFDLVSATRTMVIKRVLENNIQEENARKKNLPPSGTHFASIDPPISGENNYSFDTSLAGDYRVTSFGFVYLGIGSRENLVEEGFGIHATFSDGSQKTYGKDQIKGGGGVKEENTFYGIKAPRGHYITSCVITTGPRAWGAMDSLGFVLEKPDVLTLKPDYEQLTFSSFCNQNMENITESIVLPTVTAGGCTVDWTAKMADNTLSDVIATDETDTANLGKVNLPDFPEKSEVRLSAAVSYGVLTFVRNFDLYVPSKLEIDYKKISVPEKTKANITLPTVGSEYGSTITWKSLDTNLIDNSGNVTRPDGMLDKYCVLEATLTNEAGGTLVKEFGVTVEGTGHDNSEESGSGSSTGIVSTGGGGGGGGATAKPPVPVEVKPPVEVAPSNNTFADVPEEHWAYESIAELTRLGIVNGVGEGSFNPEGTVTREQYLSMLVRAFGFKHENAAAEFTDVEKNSWYFDAVSVAQSLGICGGYEDGSFGIGKEITREEMAVMAYRSALLAELDIEPSDKNTTWKDSGEISYFAYNAVAALNSAGVIKGISEEKFSPKTTTTRAQAAVIIQRLLNAME